MYDVVRLVGSTSNRPISRYISMLNVRSCSVVTIMPKNTSSVRRLANASKANNARDLSRKNGQRLNLGDYST